MRPARQTLKAIHSEILSAILNYVDGVEDRNLDKFRSNLRDWGEKWVAVGSRRLPAAGYLTLPGIATGPRSRALISKFDNQQDALLWEQSYSKEDNVIGNDMLAGYGFVEIIGSKGPFVSDRIRCGLGVWGPEIHYPAHRHHAEEIYLVLAGSAMFKVGDQSEQNRFENDVIHVSSMTPHGFRTGKQPLVVLYFWQNGNLREISTFQPG